MDELKTYIDSALESNKRSRWILIAFAITNVLAFSIIWNSAEFSWFQKRAGYADNAARLLHQCDPITRSNANPFLVNEIKSYAALKGWVCKEDSLVHNPFDHSRINRLAEQFEKNLIENVYTIKVPFFNVVFDVNDFCMLLSISFAIIFIFYRNSLKRELKNLEIVFSKARKIGKEEDCYQLMSMGQLFTYPKVVKDGVPKDYSPLDVVFMRVPYFILILSILIYLLAWVQFLGTLQYGWKLSHVSFIGVLGISLFHAIIIGVVFTSCVKCIHHIHEFWQAQAKKIEVIDNQTEK